MSPLPSVEESEKQLTKMAEYTITPELIHYMSILGIFIMGLGTGQMIYEIGFLSIFTLIFGGLFYGLSWYVRKNFEWK